MPPAALVRIAARIPIRAEHAHRKNHFLQRVSFIEMHAALHRGHGNVAHFADHQASGVADRPSSAGSREFSRTECASRRSSSSAKAPKPEPSTSAIFGRSFVVLREDESSRAIRPATEETSVCSPLRLRDSSLTCGAHRNMIPTIDADIRFAMVPASMARMPSRARSSLFIRRQRADAADLNSNRAEIREAAQREGGDGKRTRIERVLHRAEALERDQFVRSPCAGPADCRSPCNRARERQSPTRRARKPSRKFVRGWRETR